MEVEKYIQVNGNLITSSQDVVVIIFLRSLHISWHKYYTSIIIGGSYMVCTVAADAAAVLVHFNSIIIIRFLVDLISAIRIRHIIVMVTKLDVTSFLCHNIFNIFISSPTVRHHIPILHTHLIIRVCRMFNYVCLIAVWAHKPHNIFYFNLVAHRINPIAQIVDIT